MCWNCVWCYRVDETIGSESSSQQPICVKGSIAGPEKSSCVAYRWFTCKCDGRSLFLAVVIAGPITLIFLLMICISFCCCCCYCCRNSRKERYALEEDYIRNGGSLDPKERKRMEEERKQRELSQPLVSPAAENRANLRAKYGIKN